MTELEQARAHLLACQRDLQSLRLADFPSRIISTHEAYVLAALSWVWEAQQRDAERKAKEEAAAFFSTWTNDLPGFSRCLSYAEYQKQYEQIVELPNKCHPSHKTRASDASSFDEVCIKCGARDSLGSWGDLRFPCKGKQS
jgi:hypothetical protein